MFCGAVKVIFFPLFHILRMMRTRFSLCWVSSGWQPRWFVLENGVISYYDSEDDVGKGSKGSIKMSVCDIKGQSAVENVHWTNASAAFTDSSRPFQFIRRIRHVWSWSSQVNSISTSELWTPQRDSGGWWLWVHRRLELWTVPNTEVGQRPFGSYLSLS